MTTVVGAIKELTAKMEEKLDALNAKAEKRAERLERKLDKLNAKLSPDSERRRHGRKSYKVLILESLVELDGRGTTDAVGNLVEKKKGSDFKKHSCTSERAEMVRKGWLEDDPDKSIWQITDEGRRLVAEVS